jgi:hypothetical protein
MPGGYLEVGLNDQDEIVINHPDLKPDENGVGHIVFSPAQALQLARLLVKHAKAAGVKPLPEAHRARHIELHKAFDELLADYLMQHADALPSKMSLLELIEWSHQETITPTEPSS